MSETTKQQVVILPYAREKLGELVDQLRAVREQIDTGDLPSPHGLYRAIKRDGEGTRWNYRCTDMSLSLLDQTIASLTVPTQEEERLRKALNQIADLGSCSGGKKPAHKLFQDAIDIATGAL